jgi:hypothetical protein
MSDTLPEANPDLVYDLFWGIFKPQFIRLALQFDVLTPLVAGSTTPEQVSQSYHCDTCGVWIPAACCGAFKNLRPTAPIVHIWGSSDTGYTDE